VTTIEAWIASAAVAQVGNDTQITLSHTGGPDDTILLKNVAASTLTAHDFIIHV
jgi:hypothetical protein